MMILSLFLAVTVAAKHTEFDKGTPLPGEASVSAFVSYTASTLKFTFIGKDEPKGRFILQVRPGERNLEEPLAPFCCEVENKVNGKLTDLLAPSAHSRETPHFLVKNTTRKIKGEWETTVRFPFRGRLKWWPMFKATKKNPINWWAAIRYIDEGGKTTDWGTSRAPLEITWLAKPDLDKAREELFLDHDLIEDYRPMRGKYCDIFQWSDEEKWVGYINPGVETFAWRQADSERLFHERYSLGIVNEFDEAIKLLEWGRDPVKPKLRNQTPKSLKLHGPAQQRLFKMLDDINYVSDPFAVARHQYLCDRFMGRKLPDSKVKAKVKDVRTLPFADESESADTDAKDSISLDDDELDF